MKYARYIVILILVFGAGFAGYKITKGNIVKEGGTVPEPTSAPTAIPTPSYPKTVGLFQVTNNEVCLENGKPSVYFFGSSTCPHCTWEKPIAQKVFGQFKDLITYHENFDSQNDSEVFLRYKDINPGYIPFLVLGCKYARVGAGETLGKTDAESQKLEAQALTAILCKLTGDKPTSVCTSLKDQTSQIP